MKPFAAIAALVLSGLAVPALAQQPLQNLVLRNSFNPTGAGARGLGMGGAFVAVADDGTAASFNPAGLTQLRRTELSAVGFFDGLTATRVERGLTGGIGSDAAERTSHVALDFVGLAVPFETGGRNLTVQVSYQRTVDLFGRGSAATQDVLPAREVLTAEQIRALQRAGVQIADGSLFNEESGVSFSTLTDPLTPIVQKGAFHTASLGLGYQVTPRLSLGTSFSYWVAEWNATGGVRFSQSLEIPSRALELTSVRVLFDQQQSLRAFNMNAGFLLRYPRLSVGGTLRLPFSGDYELVETDTLETQNSPLFAPELPLSSGPATEESAAVTRLRWPRSGGLGVALRPFTGLTLAADVARTHWSRAVIENLPGGRLLSSETETPEGGIDRNFFDLEPAAETRTLDTSQWRAGVEYLVTLAKVVVPLRAGYFHDTSPVRSLDGAAREIRGLTAGTGLNWSRFVLDVAFERRDSEGRVGLVRRRNEELVDQPNAPIEQVRESRVVASLVYRFDRADDPLKRFFRYLFVGGRDY